VDETQDAPKWQPKMSVTLGKTSDIEQREYRRMEYESVRLPSPAMASAVAGLFIPGDINHIALSNVAAKLSSVISHARGRGEV